MKKGKSKKSLPAGIAVILAVIVCIVTSFANSQDAEDNSKTVVQPSRSVIVNYFDVGQGDCEFIQLPNGKCMLIDAGTSDYANSIADKIEMLGYSKIDYVVATHPHADHIGGMTYVIENFDIGSIYMPRVSANTATFEKMLNAISDKGLKIDTAKAGVTIDTEISGLDIEFLSPVSDDYSDLNNYSAVLKIAYGKNSFLFTGDAEELVEQEMLENSYANLNCDVLKVGHHGSRYSSSMDFLMAVNPKYAVIECGKDNSYGHPHEEALDNLNKIGAKIMRTDQSGDIKVISDGANITIGD